MGFVSTSREDDAGGGQSVPESMISLNFFSTARCKFIIIQESGGNASGRNGMDYHDYIEAA